MYLNHSPNFNTSHVTVYPDWSRYTTNDVKFQYISCYCLSNEKYEQMKQALAFQYISCYCLSTMVWPRVWKWNISIHLMLLFIESAIVPSTSLVDFNTSHVTVYRCSVPIESEEIDISIHLMLLFINNRPERTFQNTHFNTSHVTVYRSRLSVSDWTNSISIHLMLLFISISIRSFTYNSYFNTSHVTVYHPVDSRHRCGCLFQYISCYCLSVWPHVRF